MARTARGSPLKLISCMWLSALPVEVTDFLHGSTFQEEFSSSLEPSAQFIEEVKYGILGVLSCPDIIKTHCEQKELYGSQPEMPPGNVPHSFSTDRKLTERKL